MLFGLMLKKFAKNNVKEMLLVLVWDFYGFHVFTLNRFRQTYLFEWKSIKEGEPETELSSIHWSTPQMAAALGLVQV